jgi:hypothetical protein
MASRIWWRISIGSSYFTATVTCSVVLDNPTFTKTDEGPGLVFAGILALIWKTPLGSVGASPE